VVRKEAAVAQSVIGREPELATAERFLDASGTAPAALLIEGEAGIGKTAIFEAVTEDGAARGFRVLQCRCSPAETKLTFAALSDLLASVTDDVLSDIPAPQRHALDVALLRAEPARATFDWRATGTGLLSALLRLSESAPVLVAIDDLHWIDRPSARTLEFAARRLAPRAIGLVVSTRPPQGSDMPLALDRALPPAAVSVIRPGPLSIAALYQLIHARLGEPLERSLLVRVADSSGGNPFYALEIARALLRSGHRPGPSEALPLPDTLADLLAVHVEELSADARDVLLVAASTPSPTVELLQAVTGQRRATAGLKKAEQAGIVAVEDGRVRFTHPLLGSAVDSGASPEDRRLAHTRLARAVDGEEARVRHAALGAHAPNAQVASELERVAATGRARGAPESAAELLDLALRLTPAEDVDDWARRVVVAADYTFVTGDAARARLLLRQLPEATPAPLQTRALVLEARIAWQTDGGPEAVDLCERALLSGAGDSALEAEAHTWAAEFSDFDESGRSRHARAALECLGELPDPDPGLLASALKAYAESELVLGRGLPLDAVERATELEREGTPHRVADRAEVAAGWWLVWTDDLAEARRRLEAGLKAALDERDESSLLQLYGWLRELELRSGNFEEAERRGREQLALAEQSGSERFRAAALGRIAMVEAHLGRVEEARAAATISLASAESHSDDGLAVICLWALGFLELSLGEFAAAGEWFERAETTHERIGLVEPGYARFHADHVETLLALGRHERAGVLLERLEARARAVDRPSALAGAARCRALLHVANGETEAAEDAIAEALRQQNRLTMPFERARILLTRGQLFRRARRRKAALASLEEALAAFEGIGAPLWAATAQRELERIGLRRGDPHELTDTERRVAELAASGLTNKQIAGQAFLAPKSVEDVMTRVYRKLGIHSRAELGARIGQRTGA
jgi:ATP/maltotriose-dependent transcriptional regulator MalT